MCAYVCVHVSTGFYKFKRLYIENESIDRVEIWYKSKHVLNFYYFFK